MWLCKRLLMIVKNVSEIPKMTSQKPSWAHNKWKFVFVRRQSCSSLGVSSFGLALDNGYQLRMIFQFFRFHCVRNLANVLWVKKGTERFPLETNFSVVIVKIYDDWMCEGSPILPQLWNSVKLTRKLPKVSWLWRTLSLSWHRSQRFFRFIMWSHCCTFSIESRAWIEAKTRRARRFLWLPVWFIGKLLISFQFIVVASASKRATKEWEWKSKVHFQTQSVLKIWKNQLQRTKTARDPCERRSLTKLHANAP